MISNSKSFVPKSVGAVLTGGTAAAVPYCTAIFYIMPSPSSKRVGGVGLGRKSPKLRSWRCTQPRAAKATAGVAVVGKMASITRAAAVV